MDHNRHQCPLYQFFRFQSRLSRLWNPRNHFLIYVIIQYLSSINMSYKSRKSLLKDKRRIERSHPRRRLHEWLFWPNSCSGLAFHWICSWIWFSDSRHLDFVWRLCHSGQCHYLSRNRNFLSKCPHFHWVCLILNDLHFYLIFFFV